MARSRSIRLLLLLSLSLMAASGGPDSGDAVFTDSSESDGPPHIALDLSGGTDLGLSDDGSSVVSLPFTFSWYGTEYDEVVVSNNGTVFFDGSQSSPITSCPGGSGSWSGIAAFADDLGAGTVRVATLGRYPHRVFAVEWVVPHASVGGEGTIQAWLLEGGGRRQESVIVLDDVSFGSSSVDGGAGAVVGVQPGDGSAGLAWSCSGGLSDGSSAWFGALGSRPASTRQFDNSLSAAWYGTDTYGYAGQAIAAGEVNGDSLSDLLIGQPQDDVAYLVYGSVSTTGGDFATTAAVTLSYDESDSPDLGSTALLSDLNGDGLDDLLLGAPRDDTSATNAGAVYGMAGGTLASAVSLPDDADLVLGGPSDLGDARVGSALASADMDGDGYLDLVLGAPYADTNDTQAGAVYLWYGSLSSMDGDSLDLDASPVLYGESLTDWAGYAVAARDLDSDGLPELLVGAPNNDETDSDAGAVYFVTGATSVSMTRDLSLDSDVVILGDTSGDKAGSAVGLGDLDGDSVGDLYFGAPYGDNGSSNAGQVYVFFDPVGLGTSSYAASDADVFVYATASNATFGATLWSADLDGDGGEELLAAAPNELSAASGGGSVRILDASSTGSVPTSDAESVLVGSISAGQLGEAFTVADDVNGDGYVDIVAGAPYADFGITGVGVVHLWSIQPAFEDADGDGFVTTAAGGLDCDDEDSAVYPGATEDLSNLIDDDCDGWVDDLYAHRKVSDWFDYDVLSILGEDASAGFFDFEDVSSGDDLETIYSERGLTMTSDSGAYVSAAGDVWGAAPSGSLGVKLTSSSSDNSLILELADDVDAISLRLLDVEEKIELAALSNGTLLFEGASLEAAGDDRTGGVFTSILFSESADELIFTGPSGDSWGLDDLSLYWSSRTDRDEDGYTEDSGDCDDTDPDVNPSAEEDFTNGIDDDCDGSIDGGSLDVGSAEDDWVAEADIDIVKIDFEDLSAEDIVDDDYADLGLIFSGDAEATDDVDGSAPRDEIAVVMDGTIRLQFDEVQPAVGLWLLDVYGDIDIDGYAGDTLLYSTTLALSNNDTDEGSFVGMFFDYGVDELVISSGSSSDKWGIDDLSFSALGLDDADGDGFTEADGDCDDSSADINPDEEEVWYDGTDSDCDGESDYDADGDGHDSTEYGGGDCVDLSDDINPDEEEVWYDGVDQDCDFGSDYDADGDGYDYDPDDPESSEDCDDSSDEINPDADETWYDGVDDNCNPADDNDADGDGYSVGGSGGIIGTEDCDDTRSDIGPDADEVWYDGVDQDCDEESDYDADGDGYDSELYGGEDCEDDNPDAYPGASGEVWYDGVDQDCDGTSDYDADLDGYDSEAFGGQDCDDTDDTINPDAEDPPGDGIDTNCDDAPEYDDDEDGYDGVEDGGRDCDDEDSSIYPGAEDTWYDGIDSNCDGESDYDADNDSFDSDLYGGDDCDDTDATINPGAVDYYYDGIDNDCDGLDDFDSDGDTYAADWYGGDDCDDTDPNVNPGSFDIWYDGVDSDCDGLSDYDADGDGFDSDVYGGKDCDDTNSSIGPLITEIPFDGIDQDCDGIDDVDDDDDGVLSSDDCDDNDASIYPGAEEVWYDGVDQDCDGWSDNDADMDGFDAEEQGGLDCDDTTALISPGAVEVWYDGFDQNCDGASDYDADRDGYVAVAWGGEDCDDAESRANPGNTTDDCDSIDNDCDGAFDEDCVPSTEDTGDTTTDTGESKTGDTGESKTGDTGDTEDTGESKTDDTGESSTEDSGGPGNDSPGSTPNSDWTPPEGGPPVILERGCTTVVGGTGWLAAMVLLWGRRRQSRG